MTTPSVTTRFFNHLGQRFAYFYVRRLLRSEVEWVADVPPGPKLIAANHPTTTDPFLMMSWPFEPIYILITEDAFKMPVVGQFLRLAGHVPVNHYAEFEPVGTMPSFQKRGLGSALLAYAHNRLHEKGCPLATVQSWSTSEGANKLYQAAGLLPKDQQLNWVKS